jgi:hypothetical protein
MEREEAGETYRQVEQTGRGEQKTVAKENERRRAESEYSSFCLDDFALWKSAAVFEEVSEDALERQTEQT